MTAQQPAVKKYIVKLTAEERNRLDVLIQKGKSPARQLLKARILLKAGASTAGEAWSDSRIAAALDTSIDTIARKKTLSLSALKPNKANGSMLRISLSTAVSNDCSRTRMGGRSIQPAADLSPARVCIKLPLTTGPLWTTTSASTKPGGGSFQPSKVRTATLRLIATHGGERRRRLCPDCPDLPQGAIYRRCAHRGGPTFRTSLSSRKWPWRSIASTRMATRGRSRMPHSRPHASQITTNASRTAWS